MLLKGGFLLCVYRCVCRVAYYTNVLIVGHIALMSANYLLNTVIAVIWMYKYDGYKGYTLEQFVETFRFIT